MSEREGGGGGMFIDFKSNTFDTTNALCAMFLWILFGYLSNMVNCDLQRMIEKSLLVRHLIGVLSFYFLFTLIDGKNAVGAWPIFVKTAVVYVLFIFSTKSKWYFVVPVLVLLMIDQIMKKEYEYKLKRMDGAQVAQEAQESLLSWHANLNNQLNVLIITIIVVGMLHYMWLQWREYGPEFNLITFLFGINDRCKPYHPDYAKMNPMRKRLMAVNKQ